MYCTVSVEGSPPMQTTGVVLYVQRGRDVQCHSLCARWSVLWCGLLGWWFVCLFSTRVTEFMEEVFELRVFCGVRWWGGAVGWYRVLCPCHMQVQCSVHYYVYVMCLI